jgi:hypothetical protein
VTTRKAARPLRRYLRARVRAALLYRTTPPPGTRPGLSGIFPELFERGLIILHGRPLSGRWAVDPKLLFSPAIVSAECVLRSNSSFSAPGGRSAASSRAVLANDARRSCRDNSCLKRRRLTMARSFPFQRKAGAQPAFTSPIRATDRAVMQDQYPSSKSVPVPCSLSQNIELLHDAPSSVAAVVGDAPGHAGALMRETCRPQRGSIPPSRIGVL